MDKNINKVVIMSNNPDAVGGVTTVVNTLAAGFRNAGYATELFSVSPTHKGEEYLLDKSHKLLVGCDLPIPSKLKQKRLIDFFNPRIYINNYIREMRLNRAARNLSSAYNSLGRDCVLIITQVYGAEMLSRGGIDLSNNKGPRIVGMYHGSFKEASSGRDLKRVKRQFKDVDKFLCLTESDMKDFRIEGMANVGYIQNPVLIDVIDDNINPSNLIVSLGRYSPEKSLDYMINAWSKIAGQYTNWRLELYGGGPDEHRLQKLIKNLEISKNTQLMGKTKDVASVLSRASINVMSSQHEGLPMVVVEAAMFGVPTVSFDSAPGIKELITEGTGVVVRKNDTEALSKSLAALIESEKTRKLMGIKAKQESQRFNVKKIISKWEDIFKELVV